MLWRRAIIGHHVYSDCHERITYVSLSNSSSSELDASPPKYNGPPPGSVCIISSIMLHLQKENVQAPNFASKLSKAKQKTNNTSLCAWQISDSQNANICLLRIRTLQCAN